MSEVTRHLKVRGAMEPSPHGKYVRYEDYLAATTELESVKARLETERLNRVADVKQGMIHFERRLEAERENERLASRLRAKMKGRLREQTEQGGGLFCISWASPSGALRNDIAGPKTVARLLKHAIASAEGQEVKVTRWPTPRPPVTQPSTTKRAI